MYTKPTIYRAFSIYRLVSGALAFLFSVVSGIIYGIAGTTGKLFGLSFMEYLPAELSSFISGFFWVMSVVLILTSAISFFFCYMDFSSMFQFADLIEHEQRGINAPIRKRSFVLSPKAYKAFGNVVFTIYMILCFISAVVVIIVNSVAHDIFIAVPLIPIAIMGLSLFIIYITYAMRYKAFGDVLEVATEADQNDPSAQVKESLQENKTGILRGWCTTLFVICVILTILTIVSCILIACNLPAPISIIAIVVMIVAWFVSIITNAVTGCFFDNLATMVERKLIKYNLFKSAF